ncbi:TPA: phage tail protein [Streptococcus suis]|nr:phage tail protein [Streptococcus suis]
MEIKTSKGVNYVNADYTIEEKQGEYPKLTCTIPASKNKIWIDDCKELDRLYTPGEQDEFVIINPVKITKGDSYDLEITAVGAFEFDFVKSRIDDNLPTRSYTVEYLLDLVFKDTRYSYDLQGTYEKREFTNFGSDNRYKLFLQIMNRFNLEFKVIGKIVRINSKIGNDTGFQFRYLKNIKDTKYSVDATNLVTHVKGYGAYHDANDQSKGRLEVEYLSPLSDIYGKLSGEPVVDERMSISATLLEKCKQSVESSVAVTVSTTLVALKNQEYRGIARVGDSIWFIDERIELEKKIRFSTVKSYYDAFDELIKQDVQLGDKDVFSRAQSSDSASQSKLIDKQKELSDQLADVEDAIKKTYVMPSGVNRVFYSSDLPEDVPKGTIKEGDTLFRNIDGETKMYRWDGVQWELVPVVNDVKKFREELDNEIAQVNTAMQAQAQEHDRQVADILSKTQSVESLANQAKSDAASALARANQVKTEAIADARAQVATVNQALNTAKTELQSAIASADQKARDSQASATALRNDLNLQASKILAQAQVQTALTSRVSTVETLADGTRSTVAELSKTVSKATGDIASVSSRTKTVEDTLSQTRTQYEALTQTVNTQTGQIESINRKTADLQSGIDGVTERFENLRIEDNLLLNSSFNENLNQWQGTGVTIVDGKARITGEFNKTKHIYQSIKSQIANDDVSQVYIASISVKVTNYVAGRNPFFALYIDGRKNDSRNTQFGGTYSTANRLDAVNNRGVVQFATTFRINVPRNQIKLLDFRIYARDFTGEVEFEKVSLRRGDIDLGWQASPEDLRSEIASYKRTADEASAELSRQIQLADGKAVEAKTYAQQTAEGFKTRLESLETYKNAEGTRASQYFTASRDETARQVSALRTAVTNDYVAKSTFEENARSVTQRFEEAQVGSVNLVKNSEINETSNLYGFGTRRVRLEAGKKYWFGARARKNGGTADKKTRVYLYSSDRREQRILEFSSDEFTEQFTQFIPTRTQEYSITSYWFPTGGDRGGNAEVDWYMVTEGTFKPSTWSPAPEDQQSYADTKIAEYKNTVDGQFTTLRSETIPQAILTSKQIKDTRNDNQNPQWYWSNYPKQTVEEFKHSTVIGLSGESTYAVLTTNVQWGDSSGGKIKQTAKTDRATFERYGTGTSWEPWVKIANTGDLANYTTKTEFQTVKETTGLYERIIGSTESGVKDKLARIVMADSLFQTEVKDAISGTATQVSQLAGSYAIKNLTSSGKVLNQLNLNKDGSVKIDGSLVQITGRTYIQDGIISAAKIGDLSAGKITSGYLDAARIRTGAIDGSKIAFDEAFFNGLTANQAYLKKLFAKDAFLTAVQAVSISASQITGGLMRATNGAMKVNLNAGQILYYTDQAALKRVLNGYPTQFVKFATGTVTGKGNAGVTVIGSNRWNSESSNDGGFVGIRAWNGANIDQIDVVGDTVRLASSTFESADGWTINTLPGKLDIDAFNSSDRPSSRLSIGDVKLFRTSTSYVSLMDVLHQFNHNFKHLQNITGRGDVILTWDTIK